MAHVRAAAAARLGLSAGALAQIGSAGLEDGERLDLGNGGGHSYSKNRAEDGGDGLETHLGGMRMYWEG